jgi:hypothetical protein
MGVDVYVRMSYGLVFVGLFAWLVVSCAQSTPRPVSEGKAGAGGVAASAGGGAAGLETGGSGGAANVDGTAGSAGPAGATTGAGAGGGAGVSVGAGGSTAGADGGTTSDAKGPIDATVDGNDASGGCLYVLCESFGGAQPGSSGSPWSYDVDTIGTVAEIVTDKGRTDSSSFHIKASTMGGIHGYLTESETLAKTGGSFWGRAFIWYMLDVTNVHIVNVAVDGTMANGMSEQVRLVNVIGTHICTNRRSDDMGKCSNVLPDQGKWGCYEWHVTPNSIDVYLDGTMLPISETWTMPTPSLFRIGFERFTPGAAGDLWLDDIAINDSRIGCN